MTTPTFEDRIMDAIVQRFFEPQTIYTPQQRTASDGHWYTEMISQTMSAPSEGLAQQIFVARKAEILEAVLARITINEIVEMLVPKVAAAVVEQLDTGPGSGSYTRAHQEARNRMTNDVWEKVATEFGKRAVAYLQQTGGLTPVLTATVEED